MVIRVSVHARASPVALRVCYSYVEPEPLAKASEPVLGAPMYLYSEPYDLYLAVSQYCESAVGWSWLTPKSCPWSCDYWDASVVLKVWAGLQYSSKSPGRRPNTARPLSTDLMTLIRTAGASMITGIMVECSYYGCIVIYLNNTSERYWSKTILCLKQHI